jgi:hypothetical protein
MLIFKTNVDSPFEAVKIIEALEQSLEVPVSADFDLEDCDRILRLHSTFPLEQCVAQVQTLLDNSGFSGTLLTDEVFTTSISNVKNKLSLSLLCSLV